MKLKNNPSSKNHKASVLAVSLIIMGVMLVIALGISFSALQSRKASIGSSKSNVAFQNADSGVEVVMQRIKSASTIADIDPISDLDGCNGIVNSSGKYKVEMKKTDGTAVACGDPVSAIDTIKSTGYSSQDSRAIEVAVTCRGWCLLTDSAPWYGSNHLSTVVFQNKMWVVGGSPNGSDVWSSADGVNWTKENQTSPTIWEPRHDPVVLVHADPGDGIDKLWLMGGTGSQGQLPTDPNGKFKIYNDVWKSSDGRFWQKVKDNAWPLQPGDPASLIYGRARRQFDGVVFDGGTGEKMWIMGGWAGDGIGHLFNDVWSSNDGSTWTKVYDGGGSWSYDGAAYWAPRGNHVALVYNDGSGEKMWIMGGRYDIGAGKYLTNDVWSSSNGSTWTKRSDAGWSHRRSMAKAIYNNQIWIFGGNTDSVTDAESNEVWYSDAPATNWTQQIPGPSWTPRRFSESEALVYNNKLWVISGGDSATGYLQEVWSYQP